MPVVANSFNEDVELGKSEIVVARPDLALYDGDSSVADMHAGALMASRAKRVAAQLFKNTFIDGAKDDDLDVLILDRIGLARSAATKAQVTLAFARTSGGAAGSIPALTEVATGFDETGKRVSFVTDSTYAVTSGNNGPFSVVATAVEEGRVGNVAAATITNIVSSLFDTFTVTNAAASGGGNEKESDEAYRARYRVFYATLARGTEPAIEYAAKLVPSVRFAKVSETATGGVTLVVSDEDGASNLEMVSDVQDVLVDWKAAGPPLTVVGGQTLTVDFAIGLRVKEGYSLAAVEAQLVTLAEARINSGSGGETFYIDQLAAALISFNPQNIKEMQILSCTIGGVSQTSPDDLDEITPSAYQVIRAGTLTIEEI